MWGVIDESSDNPLAELWGLFKRDDDVSWQHRALCSQTDPEAFFPEKGGSTRDAKRVCAQCEVREQCLKWAIEHDERFGIWERTRASSLQEGTQGTSMTYGMPRAYTGNYEF